MLRRTVAGVLAAAFALVLTGCIEKESDRQLPRSTGHAEPTPGSAAEPAVHLEEGSTSGCLLPGSYIVYEPVRVEEAVTFEAPKATGRGATVREAWLAPVPAEDTSFAGISAYADEAHPMPLRSMQKSNWAERRPLTDGEVEPGDYYLFVVFQGDQGQHLESVDLSWTTGARMEQGDLGQVHDFKGSCGEPTEPVGLTIKQGLSYASCVEADGLVMLTFPFEAKTPTTLEAVHRYPNGAPVARTWVAPLESDLDLVSAMPWPGGMTDEQRTKLNWDARTRAAGTTVQPGTHTLFALVGLTRADALAGLDIAWRSGQTGSFLDLPSQVTVGDCPA